ncbi:hypothetical protein [Rhodococcoides fascians]|uniref:hypothetical protein n=1 Tax=Rhodococcoides fascians TaxID=1828 RepID=UPI00068C9EF4|nr:hypothetical protein [Rhodococcus fascians]
MALTSDRLTFVTAGGIGEQLDNQDLFHRPPYRPSSMMGQVARYLDPELWNVVQIPWRREYGPVPRAGGASFDAGLAEGIGMAVKIIRDDPNPVVLGGYSGGAALTRMVANQILRGMHGTDLVVLGLANISDPFRPRSIGAALSAGWGIAGEIPIWKMREWSVCDLNDVICCCPQHSPLRTLADTSSSMSLGDPAAWGTNLLWKIRTQQFQDVAINWRDPAAVRAIYQQAKHDLDGYRKRGDHVQYSIRVRPGTHLTHTTWLAQELNTFANERKARAH